MTDDGRMDGRSDAIGGEEIIKKYKKILEFWNINICT